MIYYKIPSNFYRFSNSQIPIYNDMSILIAFYSYYMNRKPGAMLHGSAIQKSFDFIPLF